MTTEDDFQKALDSNPDDFQTRLVFADWLQEQGDARAEGYRALGRNRRVPKLPQKVNKPGYTTRRRAGALKWADGWLPNDWFRSAHADTSEPEWTHWVVHESRRKVEDVAALAFARLSATRRTALLTGEGAEPKAAQRKKKPKAEPKKAKSKGKKT